MNGPAGVETAKARVQWADTAKGACIALVVLLHVTTKHYVQLGDIDRDVRDAWEAITEWLRPIRMPLFFVISGWFAASALRRPLRSVIRKRVAQPLYLYVLWMAVQTLAVDLWLRPYVDSASWSGFAHALLVPTGNLWYLWALAVYFVIAALCPERFRSALLATSIVATLLVASSWWTLAPRPTDLVQFAAFFLAGAIVPGFVGRLASSATPVSAAAVAAVFAMSTVWVRAADLGDIVGVTPSLYALGVWAGIGLAVMTRGRLADHAAELGRRTLPVYVMHVPILMVWSWVARSGGWRGWSPVPALMWIYPLVLSAAVIAVSLGLHRLLQRLGAWWLFALDAPVRQPVSVSG